MNNKLMRNLIKKKSKNVKRYEFYNNAIIYEDSNSKKYVAKKNNNDVLSLYNYLNSRGFGYLPRLDYCDNCGYIYEYEKDTKTPNEQKMSDLIKIDALLHNKTVYYKDISIDEVKEIYEKLKNKIDNTYNYYDDLITMIEGRIYMSPSEYLLTRNCSSIFSCLSFCQKELDDWYKIMSTKSKKRVVLLHNNLDTKHLIKNKGNILISWDKATRDLPIYDFIKIYKKNYDKYDFNELYKEYISKFPLLEEEKKLMYVILLIPEKINFLKNELKSTINVGRLCNYLYTTDNLFMENEAENTKIQNKNINEK